MTYVEVSVNVARPAEEVFAYITNFENNPLWQKGMESCVFTSEPPLRVGTTYVQVAHFLGRRIESNFEVTALEPGRLIKFETTSSTFPIQIERSVTPVDGGCQVRAVISGGPGGVFRLAAPLMDLMVRRSIRADYARLKRLLEA